MPRAHATSSHDADQPKIKRQKLTNSQLERKRELDREAQRTIRERTKNHIAHLEALVQQLQGEQGSQVERLVAQLNESRAEVNRLRDALSNITKISASTLGTNQASFDSSQQNHVKQETSPVGQAASSTSRKRRNTSLSISNLDAESDSENGAISDFAMEQHLQLETPDATDSHHSQAGTHQYPEGSYQDAATQLPQHTQTPTEQSPILEGDGNFIDIANRELSVSQMASSIMANDKLEGRYWYLAGALLTEILKKQQQDGLVNFANDEDIALRAVFEGWSSVLERYPLDRGWQWLKELDENIYFRHFGPAERLMNLRNCRYQFLNQCYPDAGWSKHLPTFYHSRPLAQQDVGRDPLGEHFPWPGFRKQLQYSPTKFATNKFMEALRCNLHFIWNDGPDALYQRNSISGTYTYSDLFLRHISDIKCYAARPSFFSKFPELGQEIPWNRNDEPSPWGMISHRSPVRSHSTTDSTSKPSPPINEKLDKEGEEVEGEEVSDRHTLVTPAFSDTVFWQSNIGRKATRGFVKELSQ